MGRSCGRTAEVASDAQEARLDRDFYGQPSDCLKLNVASPMSPGNGCLEGRGSQDQQLSDFRAHTLPFGEESDATRSHRITNSFTTSNKRIL